MNDYTDQIWVTAFNEVAEQIFNGVTANELQKYKESDTGKYKETINRALCGEFVVAGRTRTETYNDNSRTKYNILRINKPIMGGNEKGEDLVFRKDAMEQFEEVERAGMEGMGMTF